jgi:hypothetical protein
LETSVSISISGGDDAAFAVVVVAAVAAASGCGGGGGGGPGKFGSAGKVFIDKKAVGQNNGVVGDVIDYVVNDVVVMLLLRDVATNHGLGFHINTHGGCP